MMEVRKFYLDAAFADSISISDRKNGDVHFGKMLLLGAETLEGPDFDFSRVIWMS